MKKILVTGGLGYIGSHTVVELQNEGFEVIIIDDLSNTTIEVLDKITSITGIKPTFEEIDLKDKEAVKHFFKYYDIDGVIHFAASKAVGESVNEPLKYYENNIATLTYVLKEMLANNVSHFIFSSSCTVYGQADELPITESAPTKPAESPYGATKKMGEIIIEDTSKVTELKAIALRYFNPIGAHETAKIGELPIGVPQNLIPYVVQTAAGIRECLSIFGDDQVEQYCEQENIPVVMTIPFDRTIAETYAVGTPLVDADPSWRERFIELANRLREVAR